LNQERLQVVLLFPEMGEARIELIMLSRTEARQNILNPVPEIDIIGIIDCIERKKFESNLGSGFASKRN